MSVVLPMYRTAAFFPELHRRLVETLESHGESFELVVVDDACGQGSGDVVRAHAAIDQRIRAIYHHRNLGQQVTMMDGIRQTTGDVVVCMDADLQDDPEDIPRLLETLRGHPVHAVFAGRRGQYQHKSRMISSRVFKGLVALMLGVPADAGSFVAMSRTLIGSITGYKGSHPYLLALVGGTGLRTMSIPVTRARRPAGQSAYSSWGRLQFAMRALRTAMTLKMGRMIR